jgi:endonuclease-3
MSLPSPRIDTGTILQKIHRMLQDYSPNGVTAIEQAILEDDNTVFRILITTILSHRTRDCNTNKAAGQLFSVYKNAKELKGGDLKEIQRLIKPVGFYRTKARRIKELSKLILDRFDGRVPSNMNDLLSLPSVGRKTANCVLVYGFKKPAMPVDTHVHRIANRLGWVKTKTPKKTEDELMVKIDRCYWLRINELFVRFGQIICRPRSPKCKICLLSNSCTYYLAKAR